MASAVQADEEDMVEGGRGDGRARRGVASISSAGLDLGPISHVTSHVRHVTVSRAERGASCPCPRRASCLCPVLVSGSALWPRSHRPFALAATTCRRVSCGCRLPHAPVCLHTPQQGNDRAYTHIPEAHRSAGTRTDTLAPQNLPVMSDEQPRVGLLIPAQAAISGRSLTTDPGPHRLRRGLQVLCGPSPRRQLRKRNRNLRILPRLS